MGTRNQKLLKKDELIDLIETFLFERLEEKEYQVISLQALDLLTWNRFDLAFKLLYLSLLSKNKDLAEEIYFYDIRSQTHGKFSEYGNEEKDSLNKYIQEFEHTFSSMQTNGFDANKSLIPLATDRSIFNGAHRIASAIYLEEEIKCIQLDQQPHTADFHFFYNRNVPYQTLDQVAIKFIEYAKNVHLAFLWPSGIGFKEEAEKKFSNIVYKKEIRLSPKGGYNLLFELYKHMDWIGTTKNEFSGIKQKLIECFPNFESFTVIAFQADSLDEVRKIKEEVRQVYNIGFSSIHITDTKEEAMRISKLIFNDNGLHLLNYAEPLKYPTIYEKLDAFGEFLELNGISKEDVVLDGSLVLSVYGIRKNEDIDYLVDINDRIKENSSIFELHDSELKYHEQEKNDLLYNPNFYFQFRGFKFISFTQLYIMKKNRGEEKDINDCNIMDAFFNDNKLKEFIARSQQTLFYLKIKTHRRIMHFVTNVLKTTGLYSSVRWIYRKLK